MSDLNCVEASAVEMTHLALAEYNREKGQSHCPDQVQETCALIDNEVLYSVKIAITDSIIGMRWCRKNTQKSLVIYGRHLIDGTRLGPCGITTYGIMVPYCDWSLRNTTFWSVMFLNEVKE